MTEFIQVVTTVENKEQAVEISRSLVRQKLAGCVQVIGPITSTYWWQDEMVESEEWLCLIKTSKTLFSRVEEAVKALHPYDVPEILAVPVEAGGADYLKWLQGELGS